MWLFFYTLASTDIDQSAPNLVKMYMTIRSQMSSMMDLVGPELFELSALNSKICHIWQCLHSSICKYWPISTNLCHNIYVHKVSDELGQIESEHPELFALEFGKIAESDFVYTLASTNIDQSTPNIVKMYVTIRSWMSSIMDLIGSELFELSAFEFEN